MSTSIEGDVSTQNVQISKSPWQYRLAKVLQWMWRFNGLQVADRLFAGMNQSLLLRRRFAGRQLYLDVSRSVFHQLLFLEGERLIHERFLLRRLVKPNMRVVDIGANIGYYTLLLHEMIGPQGHLTAIEPSIENLPELRRNIERNRLTNVSLLDCAVGSRDGRIGLKSGINSGVADISEASFSAEIHHLDSLISQPVDFIKIDVEGYEGHVLEGSRKVLTVHRPILFLEFHPLLAPRYGTSFKQVIAFLSSIYSSIEFFGVSDEMHFSDKFATRYLNRDCVRRIDVQHIPEEELHRGRAFGTFWIVCR